MDVGNTDLYFYNSGFRRGSDIARIIVPLYDSSYSKDTVFSSILEHERIMREEPIFWPIDAMLESYGSSALESFNCGVAAGAKAVLRLDSLSSLKYLPDRGAL